MSSSSHSESQKESESESELVVPAPTDAFYPAATSYREPYESSVRGQSGWNKDGTFTFQHENTLTTLSTDNQVVETVTISSEYLPEGGGYNLTWSGSRILAIANNWGETRDQVGVAYFTDDGGVYLANITLFGRQGTLIRQSPQSQVYSYDDAGTFHIELPAPENTEIITYYGLVGGNDTYCYWLDDETVIFDCHSRIVLYDFAADTGRVLDDMSEFVDKFGKFGVYYGAESDQCGVLDGSFYYLAVREENSLGSVWRGGKTVLRNCLAARNFIICLSAKRC